MTDIQETHQNVAPGHESEAPSAPSSGKTKLVFIVVVILLIAGGVLWYLHSMTYEDTDDAQINGHINTLAARVDGTVKGVYVENNHPVQAGQPLVDLDPADFKVALDQSQAQLAQASAVASATTPNLPITQTSNLADITSAQAAVLTAKASVAAAVSDLATAHGRLEQSQANNARAQADLVRYKQLLDKNEVAPSQYDQYLAAARAQQATVNADAAAVQSARDTIAQRKASMEQQEARLQQASSNAPRQVLIRTADIKTQEASVQAAQAAVERNQLNLDYTHIVAPVSGLVIQRSAEGGDRVSTGQQLMQIVQTDGMWVDAHFKETQLKKMHVGERVSVQVDALDQSFEGTVEAMPAATGDRSSLFPPENATGNYVKVVQRLTVRVRLNPGQSGLEKLRPGMSVVPTVHLD
jgi:membrane fusion protein (multidrug efflux system)